MPDSRQGWRGACIEQVCSGKELPAVRSLFIGREAATNVLTSPIDALAPKKLSTATFGVG
jgi:hypothetical protein